MRFISTIIVVDDIVRSRYLYESILQQKVTADFGIYYVGFDNGLALYKKTLFQGITGGLDILEKANNFVLYFEVEDIDELEKEIAAHDFDFIHRTREQPWNQSVFRFYDFDHNIVEIAERMERVSYRLYQEGMTINEIPKITGLSEEEVMGQINPNIPTAG